jgi:hypothetical protein
LHVPTQWHFTQSNQLFDLSSIVDSQRPERGAEDSFVKRHKTLLKYPKQRIASSCL